MQKKPKHHKNKNKKPKSAASSQRKKPEKAQAKPQPKLPRASLYGFHAVCEAWLNEDRSIERLYVTDAGLKSFEETLERARRSGLARPEPQIVDKAALEKALPQGAVHQGLALVSPHIEEASLQDFIIRAANTPCMLVVLDQVTDPHNVGAILRSA